jgi:hypothetical protein
MAANAPPDQNREWEAEFAEAWQNRVEVEGFPVCSLDHIIASKAATNRVKDRESLPRLRAFREYWQKTRPR